MNEKGKDRKLGVDLWCTLYQEFPNQEEQKSNLPLHFSEMKGGKVGQVATIGALVVDTQTGLFLHRLGLAASRSFLKPQRGTRMWVPEVICKNCYRILTATHLAGEGRPSANSLP